MTPTRYTRICELFDEARGVSMEERRSFLDRACADAPALGRQVARMIEQDEAAEQEGFLNRPPMGAIGPTEEHADVDDLMPGHRIGPYEIRRKIASGGMGTVYLAVRVNAFVQQVAIKLIKRGMDSVELLQRFRTERQVLAHLSHPNIARLLDGGSTVDGRPYFVMEYIDGEPIDRFCDRHPLSTVERVRLLRSVCRARRAGCTRNCRATSIPSAQSACERNRAADTNPLRS